LEDYRQLIAAYLGRTLTSPEIPPANRITAWARKHPTAARLLQAAGFAATMFTAKEVAQDISSTQPQNAAVVHTVSGEGAPEAATPPKPKMKPGEPRTPGGSESTSDEADAIRRLSGANAAQEARENKEKEQVKLIYTVPVGGNPWDGVYKMLKEHPQETNQLMKKFGIKTAVDLHSMVTESFGRKMMHPKENWEFVIDTKGARFVLIKPAVEIKASKKTGAQSSAPAPASEKISLTPTGSEAFGYQTSEDTSWLPPEATKQPPQISSGELEKGWEEIAKQIPPTKRVIRKELEKGWEDIAKQLPKTERKKKTTAKKPEAERIETFGEIDTIGRTSEQPPKVQLELWAGRIGILENLIASKNPGFKLTKDNKTGKYIHPPKDVIKSFDQDLLGHLDVAIKAYNNLIGVLK
jgi:hypothetical protein